MIAGIIGLVDGDVTNPEIQDTYAKTSGYAVNADYTEYLDGDQLYHGTAVVPHQTQEPIHEVTADGKIILNADTEEHTQRVGTKWVADLRAGFITIDTGRATELWDRLALEKGVEITRAEINLDHWKEDYQERDKAEVWQVGWSGEEDEAPASVQYHGDASLRNAPREGVNQLGFNYMWDGMLCRGTVAESGYIAVYRGPTTPEGFARWIRDEALEYADTPSQEELNDE